jgi:cob(I)alamin adenosyltransferase
VSGLTHIYTGHGKGKTTAAVGLAVRAAGDGLRVLFVQFLKGRATGELGPLKSLGVDVVRSPGVKKFIPDMTQQEREECGVAQHTCLNAAIDSAARYDLIILDEAFGAAETGMIDIDALAEFVKHKPDSLELVLTGRGAPQRLIELADYVSEIKAVKHPYDRGITARKGIEY